MNTDALKEESAKRIADALLREAPLVRQWIQSTDLNDVSVERGRQIMAVIDAARGPYIETVDECLEVMTPFAFMATAYDRNRVMVEICKVGVQALSAGALWSARELWLRFRDAPEE